MTAPGPGSKAQKRRVLKKSKSKSDMSVVSEISGVTQASATKKRRLEGSNLLVEKAETSTNRSDKKIDKKKFRKYTELELLENELIEVSELDTKELIMAGKSVFDSARRCLKGGKKRKVIQLNNIEQEMAGNGWKVNFRTIMKHIRERNVQISQLEEREKGKLESAQEEKSQPYRPLLGFPQSSLAASQPFIKAEVSSNLLPKGTGAEDREAVPEQPSTVSQPVESPGPTPVLDANTLERKLHELGTITGISVVEMIKVDQLSDEHKHVLLSNLEKLAALKRPEVSGSNRSVSDMLSKPLVMKKATSPVRKLGTIGKFSFSENVMKKIWNAFSFTRCYPVNEEELGLLNELEINKFIHFSLPKNEWYFGKFWFNQKKRDLFKLLQNRRSGRASSTNIIIRGNQQPQPQSQGRAGSAIGASSDMKTPYGVSANSSSDVPLENAKASTEVPTVASQLAENLSLIKRLQQNTLAAQNPQPLPHIIPGTLAQSEVVAQQGQRVQEPPPREEIVIKDPIQPEIVLRHIEQLSNMLKGPPQRGPSSETQ